MSDEHSLVEEKKRDVKSSQRRKKEKVAGYWPVEDVRKLIRAVESRCCIWDFACEDHKNSTVRSSAWQSISDHFENRFTAAVLKAKWNIIKSTYSKIKTKFLSRGSTEATVEKKIPDWMYWKDMLFIYEYELVNGTKSESNFSLNEFVDNIIEYESSSQSILLSRSPLTAKKTTTNSKYCRRHQHNRNINHLIKATMNGTFLVHI